MPDLIVVFKKERLAYLVDFSYPFDSNVIHKEIEKVDKYQAEIQRLWNVKVGIIPFVIGALDALSPKFEGWLQRSNIKLHPSVLQKTETASITEHSSLSLC